MKSKEQRLKDFAKLMRQLAHQIEDVAEEMEEDKQKAGSTSLKAIADFMERKD